jgi:hypothetical protein
MDKKPLIGVSICAVVLLVLASLSNVVGYQTVQSSNQQTIKEEVNQKELLFQTIVDIVNNKEIQRIILEYQISKECFFNPDVRFPIFNAPILTKNNLKQMYLIGLVLSKIISKSRIQSMIQTHQLITPEIHQEINAVIKKDTTLNGEITQLLDSNCHCGNSTGVTVWHFPVICTILEIILFFDLLIAWWLHVGTNILKIVGTLLERFNCPGWTP